MKQTFKAKTFASKTFKSGTFTGVGASQVVTVFHVAERRVYVAGAVEKRVV